MKIKKNFTNKKFLVLFLMFLIFISTTNLYSQDDKYLNKNLDQINKNLSTQTENKEQKDRSSITSFFIRTVFVLLILAIIYFVIKFRFARSIEEKKQDKYFSIILRQQINRNLSLAVMEFFGSYYIISIGNDISILEKIESQEIIDTIRLEAGKEMPKKTFFEYLGFPQNKSDKVNVLDKFNEIKEKINNIKKGNTK